MKKVRYLMVLALIPSFLSGCPTTTVVNPPTSYSQSDIYSGATANTYSAPMPMASASTAPNAVSQESKIGNNSEEYSKIVDNGYLEVSSNPLSTFSIDVDTASYSNIRRFIENGQTPPKDSARIEEMINYFSYDYPQPTGNDPFSINMEMSNAPWNNEHKLVSIGLQGKNIDKENMPSSNIVFLIDTSGSMGDPNKLPLLKESFKLLVNQLRKEDKVSIVAYAGSAGLVLDATSGDNKQKIISALDQLSSGGSTAGGAGINLAYKIAKDNFIKNGNNRVILATDGDFNVGASSDAELVKLIEQKRDEGTFLSVLGFGMGNYKDSKMEQLADKGNGNYAYIDGIKEAKKVFVDQMGGTLLPIAKDVKLQVEFNPVKIKSYRLIGYENRKLNNEDFNDDKKDAGELGAGTSVTALYEVVPVSSNVDALKYQQNTTVTNAALQSNELINVKFRYKDPKESESKLISKPLLENNTDFNQTSDNFRFAASVAGFGMLLRDSQYKGDININKIIDMAKNSKSYDLQGYRNDFINMLNLYNSMKK